MQDYIEQLGHPSAIKLREVTCDALAEALVLLTINTLTYL